MPRAYDQYPQRRTNADHNPIARLLDWQTPVQSAAQAAGQSINNGIATAAAPGQAAAGSANSALAGLRASLAQLVYNLQVSAGPLADVYVTDAVTNTVVELDSDGVQSTVGFTGLATPCSVDVDAMGTVYVADPGNAAVYQLDDKGVQSTVMDATKGLISPATVRVDQYRNIYIADTGGAAVYEVYNGVPVELSFTGLIAPSGLAVDDDGTVYVSDGAGTSGPYTVVKLDTEGNQTTLPFSGLTGPLGVDVDDTDGTVYVADNGTVHSLTTDGVQSTVTFPGLVDGVNVQVGDQGTVYVADTGGGGRIIELTLSDDTENVVGFTFTDGFAPQGLCVQNAKWPRFQALLSQGMSRIRADTTSAVSYWSNLFSKLGLQGLSDDLSKWLLHAASGAMATSISEAAITSANAQLLFNPNFSGAISIQGGGVIGWDGTCYFTPIDDTIIEPGSAVFTANGTQQMLLSNASAPIAAGQAISYAVQTLGTGLTGSGKLLAIYAVPWIGTTQQAAVFLNDSYAPVGGTAAWTNPPAGSKAGSIVATYTPDEDSGVTSVSMLLVVNAAATGGVARFSAATQELTGGLISNLQLDAAAKQAARATYDAAIQAAVQGYTDWPTYLAARDAAQQAYEAVVAGIDASEVTTRKQILNAEFGIGGPSQTRGIRDFFDNLVGANVDPTDNPVLPGSIGDITLGSSSGPMPGFLQTIIDNIARGRYGSDADVSGSDPSVLIDAMSSYPVQKIQPINPAASTLVTISQSGHGDVVENAFHIQISVTGDTITDNDDYALFVVECATTGGKGATATMSVDGGVTQLNMVPLQTLAGFGGSNSPVLIAFGYPNPPAGTPIFTASSRESGASAASLMQGTSIILSGVGTLEDIAAEFFNVNANPTINTAFDIAGSVVVVAVASFASSNDDPTLSAFTGGTQLYHSGKNTIATFSTDLMVGAVTNPSSPTFGATMAAKTSHTSYGAIALAFNPSSPSGASPGSGLRRYRANTTTFVSVAAGYQELPAGFFDTPDDTTDYLVYNPTTGEVEVLVTARYNIGMTLLEKNTAVSHNIRPLLYVNDVIRRKGHTLPVTSNASDTWTAGASWPNVCLNAGDLLLPGVWASRAVSNLLIGGGVADTAWEITMSSRGLL